MMNNIFEYSLCFLESFFGFVYLNNLLVSRRKGKEKYIILCVSIVVFATFIFSFGFLSTWVRLGVLALIMLLISIINFKSNIYSQICFCIYYYYILIMIDIIVGTIFSLFYETSVNDVLLSQGMTRVIVALSSKFILVVFVVLTAIGFKKTNETAPKWYWLLFNIITISFFGITIATARIYPTLIYSPGSMIAYLIMAIFFLIISYIVVYFFNKICHFYQEEKVFYAQELNQQALDEEIKLQQNMIEETNKIRHDMKNTMGAISTLVELKEYDDLSDLVKNWTNNINSVTVTNYTKYPIFNAILNIKVKMCKENNIELILNISPSLNIKIEMQDMLSLISNLFDNAIEATAQLKEEERYIKFDVFNRKEMVVISCRNSFLFTGRDSILKTKKENKRLHGYGLKIINSIVEKVNGTIDINYSDNSNFVVTILMP